jgi:hypothetical protein
MYGCVRRSSAPGLPIPRDSSSRRQIGSLGRKWPSKPDGAWHGMACVVQGWHGRWQWCMIGTAHTQDCPPPSRYARCTNEPLRIATMQRALLLLAR